MVVEIYDWDDLDDIRLDATADYELMNDLDSTTTGYSTHAASTANAGAGWNPLPAYTGTFEGNNHTISDLYIDRTSTTDVALFVAVGTTTTGSYGFVQNLNLDNFTIEGNIGVGTLAARTRARGTTLPYTTIKNVTVTNSTVTTANTGASVFAGGLIGLKEGVVEDCFFLNGTVTSAGGEVGGLIGRHQGGETADCGVDATVQTTSTLITIGGFVGGLGSFTGIPATGATSSIIKCYSKGQTSGVGGFAGNLTLTGVTTVENCYTTMNVTNLDGASGFAFNLASNTRHCYAANEVTATGGGTAHGFSVDTTYTAATELFWDATIGPATSNTGTGKTTTELKTLSTFSNWAMTSKSSFNDGVFYNGPMSTPSGSSVNIIGAGSMDGFVSNLSGFTHDVAFCHAGKFTVEVSMRRVTGTSPVKVGLYNNSDRKLRGEGSEVSYTEFGTSFATHTFDIVNAAKTEVLSTIGAHVGVVATDASGEYEVVTGTGSSEVRRVGISSISAFPASYSSWSSIATTEAYIYVDAITGWFIDATNDYPRLWFEYTEPSVTVGVKISGTFADKPLKVKSGGSFADAVAIGVKPF